MGKINGVELGLFGGNNEKRREAKEKFAAELYLSGSFFKQRRFTEGDSNTPLRELDAKIVKQSGAIEPMANPKVTTRFTPTREKMPHLSVAKFMPPPQLPLTFDVEFPEREEMKPSISILEVVQFDGLFYLQLEGNRWWKFSYESKFRADKCKDILQESWSDSEKMEDDIAKNFMTSVNEVIQASL